MESLIVKVIIVYFFSPQQIIGMSERGDRMPKNEKAPDLVEQPFVSTGTTEAEFEMDTKESKPANKPKVGNTSVGDDGISDQIRYSSYLLPTIDYYYSGADENENKG
jgi:hypothetical protein